jgi:hypothetical protein
MTPMTLASLMVASGALTLEDSYNAVTSSDYAYGSNNQ